MDPTEESRLLSEINSTLPEGVDWNAGAIDYIKQVLAAQDYADGLAKPFRKLTAGSPVSAYREIAELLENFVDVYSLLNLPAGSRVLDVACGTGWLAHLWARIGYRAYGFDICGDLLETARKRVEADELLSCDPDSMFFLHDIEDRPLKLPEPIDAAVFESCFHHFHNPVAALRNISKMLSRTGVAVLIEGESSIRPEYFEVMRKYRTIERPYTRSQMARILEAAGMPNYVFFWPVNQWVPQGYEGEREILMRLHESYQSQNRCVCSASEAAIVRIVPDFKRSRCIELSLGFMQGSQPGYWWGAPHATARIAVKCSLEFEIGPTIPNQSVSIYGRSGKLRDVRLDGVQKVLLPELVAGETLHFCSEQAISPAWAGESDIRLLSFWIRGFEGR
jgi:SAM-dependent methyltransferase